MTVKKPSLLKNQRVTLEDSYKKNKKKEQKDFGRGEEQLRLLRERKRLRERVVEP